jgi:CRISPR-associated protein Cas1
MIKRTLHFGNPAYLSLENGQLIIKLPEVFKNDTLPEQFKQQNIIKIPLEDIGVILLDHSQITITQPLLGALLENNCAVITCANNHMPNGLLLPLEGHNTQQERYDFQLEASQPLKKQLWQQTVQAKVMNQGLLLEKNGFEANNFKIWSRDIKSGDSDNLEARAAARYWTMIFSKKLENFRRGREGDPPNNLLNYGYAILRAVVARSIVAAGLIPTLGIFHRNRYNAFCLADDIMEPYRPYVDEIVLEIIGSGVNCNELTKELKQKLLIIPTLDVVINGERSPLMIATQRTAYSLFTCYEGKSRKILYPEFY